jgi:uncharacterized protein
MRISSHIAVFAKAPVAGNAKTRLIPLLGKEGAAAAQRVMTWRTLTTACAAAPGGVSLWTAGTSNHPFFLECASRFAFACHSQCAGSLGMRMASCLLALLVQHNTVLLIGTDCPALTVADLQAAANALQQGAQMVFIPAEDGGYVLVGAQRNVLLERCTPAFLQAFQGIDWGTSHVMAQTRMRLTAAGWRKGREWEELPALWDVDTPSDYARAQQAGLLDL